MADTMDVMRLVTIETVKELLRIEATEHYSGGVAIRLMLGHEAIGDPIVLEVETNTTHRHNSDHVTSVELVQFKD